MTKTEITNILDRLLKYCFIALLAFLIINVFIENYSETNNNDNSNDTNFIQIDTSYNKVILDSINYNIIKRDSIIIKLNIKLKENVKQSYNLNDSASVELFKQLVGAN